MSDALYFAPAVFASSSPAGTVTCPDCSGYDSDRCHDCGGHGVVKACCGWPITRTDPGDDHEADCSTLTPGNL